MSNAEQRVLGRRQNTNWDTVCLTPSRECAGKETEYKPGYNIYNAEQRVCWEGDKIQTGIQYNAEQSVLGRRQNTNRDTVSITLSRESAAVRMY